MKLNADDREYVLVADDADDIRTQISYALSFHGVPTILARDGREAVELYECALDEGKSVVVALFDEFMPRMRGVVAAAEVLRLAEERGVVPPRVLLVTASAETTLALEAAGVTSEILRKPEGVLAAVDRIIGRPLVRRAASEFMPRRAVVERRV